MSEDLTDALRALVDVEQRAVEASTPDASAISRQLARRVGRRRAARAGGTVAAGLVLVGGAAAGVRALDRPALPAAPAPSASVSPSPTATPLVDVLAFGADDPEAQLDGLVRAIREAYPDDFATAVPDGPTPGTGWIGFAGAVPPSAQAAIDTLPGVRAVGDLGYTSLEVAEVSSALLRLAPADGPAPGQAATWAEGDGSTLVLVYVETEPRTPPAAERRAAVDAGVADLLAAHPELTVEVRTTTDTSVGTETASLID